LSILDKLKLMLLEKQEQLNMQNKNARLNCRLFLMI
jgi:hypothetical protein